MEKDIAQGIATALVPLLLDLYKTVREYESDTFSSSQSELNDFEAIHIATTLATDALKSLVDLETLDGVRLSEELDNIRN